MARRKRHGLSCALTMCGVGGGGPEHPANPVLGGMTDMGHPPRRNGGGGVSGWHLIPEGDIEA